MAARAEDLLPVEYFHVVFTLPAEIARIAYWSKRAVYGLLFRASAETVATLAADAETVAFRWKDYRIKSSDRQKVMRLATTEFIRRFLMHVLPDGFHRIRHYGFLASATRKATIARIRVLLWQRSPDPEAKEPEQPAPLTLREPCPCCGGPMRIIEIFRRGQKPMSRAPPREQAA